MRQAREPDSPNRDRVRWVTVSRGARPASGTRCWSPAAASEPYARQPATLPVGTQLFGVFDTTPVLVSVVVPAS